MLPYLEDSDDGPQQGVKVLPVRYGVACLCLQTELTAKYVHPQNTTTQYKMSFLHVQDRAKTSILPWRERKVCITLANEAPLVTQAFKGNIPAN